MAEGIVVILAMILVLPFALVLFYGAPYLPTTRKQIVAALELAEINNRSNVLELGSGDGRVMRMIARRGARVYGFELNPLLVFVSKAVTRKYKSQVVIERRNFFSSDWPVSDVLYVFLLQSKMTKLYTKVIQWMRLNNIPKVSIISFAFTFDNVQPIAEQDGVYLYVIQNIHYR